MFLLVVVQEARRSTRRSLWAYDALVSSFWFTSYKEYLKKALILKEARRFNKSQALLTSSVRMLCR